MLQRTVRRGSVLPLVAVSLVALVGCVALAIDIGLLAVSRSQLQSAADIAAMLGARHLDGYSADNNKTKAELEARNAIKMNRTFSSALTDTEIKSVDTGIYRYDSTAKRFVTDFSGPPAMGENYGALRVSLEKEEIVFFARVFGFTSQKIGVTATAVHRPRDIAIVLDFSGSMAFGSLYHRPRGGINGTNRESNNPDPNFPRFGPWVLFPVATPGNRNPMQNLDSWSDGTYSYAPANITIETKHGPPIVEDFAALVGGNYNTPAWKYPTAIGSYDPYSKANPTVMPAPPELADQSISAWTPTSGFGDRFPYKVLKPSSPPKLSDYALTAQEYVNFLYNNPSAVPAGIATPPPAKISSSSYSPIYKQKYPDGTLSGGEWWETYGYGPDFHGWTMGPGHYGKTFWMWPPDPRTPSNNASGSSAPHLLPGESIADARKRGYEPGDWRKRFFYNTGTTTPLNGDNSRLWNHTANDLTHGSHGRWKDGPAGGAQGDSDGITRGYDVNYTAVIQWIKGGPQIFPPNLRAGRVLYYSSIPDTIPATGGTEDQVFWREYINFVLGSGRYNENDYLYGRNVTVSAGSRRWVRWGGVDLGPLRVTPDSSISTKGGSNAPYMRYDDLPIPPRAHFWFGPFTMTAFLSNYAGARMATGSNPVGNSQGMMPGTCHEAQCWQLKAGVQSALKDIKNNHPNDMASIVFFSDNNQFNEPRGALTNKYDDLRLYLWYPFNIGGKKPPEYLSNPSVEMRPYNTSWNNTGSYNIPRAASGTGVAAGLAVAFNQLSANPAVPNQGGLGRIGANKLVVLETDGVPNVGMTATFKANGPNQSYYDSINYSGGDDGTQAIAIAKQMCDPNLPDSYSATGRLAKIHCIAFGDLLEDDAPPKERKTAIDFLTAIQVAGNTTEADGSGNPMQPLEPYKIITGDFKQRIDRLREAFLRIMQGDIQVSLVE